MSAELNSVPSAQSRRPPQAASLDKKYNIRPFKHVHQPSEQIDYANLDAIDLSTFEWGDSDEAKKSRQRLARQLDHSVRTHGFFYLVNHGVDEGIISHLDSISQSIFEVSNEIKAQHLAGSLSSDLDTDSVGAERGPGFKPRQYWNMANGVKDNIEFYNFTQIQHQDKMWEQNHPQIVKDYLNEIANYYQFLHFVVLKQLTILCDIILELPEGTWYENYFQVSQGDISGSGGGFGRLMMYYGHSDEDNEKTNNTWLRGHSDSAGFTFIASQPMVSLQILDYRTREWRYVKHVPGALVVNIGDAVEFMTGGYFKSTIHRVVNPPKSQQGHVRHSIIYFSKPSWVTVIDPDEIDSPLLHRLGVSKPREWEKITYYDWDLEKGRLFGKSKVNDKPGDAPEPVYIHGRLSERWIRDLSV
ncbi:1-aminocyclopropane-1-carboxylate oxidase [Wickerhamiella sorbophila]|uniref:1-aminocyclopropane-1-carboxylate oxidase n=1 Tax=Wickerhamiella sorbophila TaxID=45607 RepID=A0A2T0FLP8_9ASCO|nr:1-aminocyclopropane-1-carboxylate oxidase [Wickerhamiella sorbophila]PRT55900.1 1-aminocyclopropane-1-carboxylate oxidase [Wickerhamiella sorbophila]